MYNVSFKGPQRDAKCMCCGKVIPKNTKAITFRSKRSQQGKVWICAECIIVMRVTITMDNHK